MSNARSSPKLMQNIFLDFFVDIHRKIDLEFRTI